MIANLISKFFQFILQLIMSLVSLILSPLTSLVSRLLPNLSGPVTTIANFIDTMLANIGYFFSMLGPTTRGAILLYLNILGIFFTIYASYIVIEVAIHLITKIKSMFA